MPKFNLGGESPVEVNELHFMADRLFTTLYAPLHQENAILTAVDAAERDGTAIQALYYRMVSVRLRTLACEVLGQDEGPELDELARQYECGLSAKGRAEFEASFLELMQESGYSAAKAVAVPGGAKAAAKKTHKAGTTQGA